jgi:hypothetical protein
MSSDNPSGGDNQQETQGATSSEMRLDPAWVCGFVDGEGCFSVAVHANPYVQRTRGWQFCPTFQVSQHRDNRMILDALVQFFGTGKVRDKGRASPVLVYSVYGAKNVDEHVVPFFERHQLLVKRRDFELFAAVVRILVGKQHLHPAGFEQAARLIYAMNQHGKQRRRTLEEVLRGSSETVREARAAYMAARDETVRAAWRHAESGRNDLAAFLDRITSMVTEGSNNTA